MATCGPSTITPEDNIDRLIDIYIQNAETLITKCQQLELKDSKKLEKKCRAELKYLMSLKKRRKSLSDTDIHVKEHDLKSSNLSHFAAILHAATNLPGVKKLLCPFRFKHRNDSLIVDVVAKDGLVWIKVVARKAQALHLIWAGKGQYGDRDIIHQAKEYQACAREHPVNFNTPEVHYAFYNDVTDVMADELEGLGIKVWGTRIPVSSDLQRLIVENETEDYSLQNDNGDSDRNKFVDGEDNLDVLGEEEEDDDDDTGIPSATELFKQCQKSQNKDMENNQNKLDLLYLMNDNEPLLKKKPPSFKCDKNKCKESKPLRTQNTSNNQNNDEGLANLLCSAPTYFFNEMKSCVNGDVDSPTEVDGGRVNLDITTMITLVSSITHGGCFYKFKDKVLSLQAGEERESPVLPQLEKFLEGKELFVCQSAVDDFQTILDTLGGDNEKLRAEKLLSTCTIVPDQPSPRAQSMPSTGKIRERSKVIFGTGDQLKCITVSANSGFVRAAEHQGVVFSVYLHQSRALTEKKELEIDESLQV